MTDKTEIPFNINQCVKVKLTDIGLKILKQQHDELYSALPRLRGKPFVPPKVDNKGYCKFQMHDLMNRFGEHCMLGCKFPFETDIILIKDW